MGPVAYRLDLSSSRLSQLHPTFHVSLLRPAKDNGEVARVPPIELADEEQEWELEALVQHRQHRGGW